MRDPFATRQTRLRLARTAFCEQGTPPPFGVRVQRSWARSLQAGLAPCDRKQLVTPIDALALEQLRQGNQALMSHSEPVMEHLHSLVRDTHCMVILADAQGVLLHTLGDLDFLGRAERVALLAGSPWGESVRGTNAIGTALAEALVTEVHGAEHFLARHEFLTCAASPIWSAQGTLLGVLDISGEQRNRHPHTLGLVTQAACMIENSLMMARPGADAVLIQLHASQAGLLSGAQALLAFAANGQLIGANRQGLRYLGLLPSELQRLSCSQLFEPLPGGVTLVEMPASERVWPVRAHSQELWFARVLRSPNNASALTGRVDPKRQPTSNPSAASALNALDTGDVTWHDAARQASRVFNKGIALLILGESGVGKDMLARALHAASPRSTQAFIAVNCAALPEHLIEAQLFGYAPGAFTGALRQGARGLLREAHGGTLFLDEIGDMPLALQTRLLRVLQERCVTPVGSTESVAVDFHLICATHQDLPDAMARGRFRSDLYYRINGLSVRLPALRERSDFDALTQRLLDELAPTQHLSLAPALRAALTQYNWPGNLRQYAAVLKTAVALLDEGDQQIDWPHLSADLRAQLHAQRPAPAAASTTPQLDPARPMIPPEPPQTEAQSLHAVSQQAIESTLIRTRGNVSAAARVLGVSRQTLYRRLSPSAAPLGPGNG